MREFVFGTDLQFANLKAQLEDNQCLVYNNCSLPTGFSRDRCRIGFEKEHGVYFLLIDLGITCSQRTGGIPLTQCKQWLAKGEYLFLDYNDMKTFLKSLRIFY